MKNQRLYDGITDIRADIIDRAEQYQAKQAGAPRSKRWMGLVAAVLALVLAGGAILWPGGSLLVTPSYAISLAQYPQMAPYPNEGDFFSANGEFDSDKFEATYGAWRDSLNAQSRPLGYADGLEPFFAASARTFLSQSGGNRVYSPLNVYMALAMLAELTAGDSRQQVLDLLGSDSLEALRAQASDLWNANYRQDGAVSSVLASSLWLNQSVSFVQETMDTLAGTYYASSYQGEMGSAAFNKALQSWLNQQTGSLLADQAAELELSPDTLLALVTTLYFQSKWSNEFLPEYTQPGVFHAPSGDMTCDFMHQGDSNTYYWADRFSAVGRRLENSGSMWFLLPDEGTSVEELLADPQVMDFILCNGEWENQKFLVVNQSIPKFDVTSQLDLRAGLQALGVTDVFDMEASDFTPMTQDVDHVYLSQVQHDARVMIDEEGCTAAAYTAMLASGAGMPPEETVDFVVDRPFLFAITGSDGLPLFIGVVEQPR